MAADEEASGEERGGSPGCGEPGVLYRTRLVVDVFQVGAPPAAGENLNDKPDAHGWGEGICEALSLEADAVHVQSAHTEVVSEAP
jgi:hypothetical protein